MKVKYIKLMLVIMFLSGMCYSSQDEYSYRPEEGGGLTLQSLLQELKPTVKTLDLSGHKEVDDKFIQLLCEDEKSKTLVNINLSGTSVTEASLKSILESTTLGTQRDLPQISGRYSQFSAEIYLDVTKTNIKDTKLFQSPISGITLKYGVNTQNGFKKTADDKTGIKLLTFKKN